MADDRDARIAQLEAENAALRAEVEQRDRALAEALDRQTATADILRVIASTPTDVQAVIQALLEHAARLCQAPAAWCYEIRGDLLMAMGWHGRPPIPGWKIAESMPMSPGFINGRAALEGVTIHLVDLLADLDDFPDGQEGLERFGHRTALATPLRRHGRVIGTMALMREEVRRFTEQEIALLETFADQAVIAIANARLVATMPSPRRWSSRRLPPRSCA